MQGSHPARIAVAALVFLAAALVACSPRAPSEVADSSSPTPVATPAPTPSPIPRPATPEPPGFTVTEAIALRDAGGLGADPFTLNGFWSNRIIPHSCVVGPSNMGELELWCHGDEYGITERNEPVLEWVRPGQLFLTDGPRLVPWMPDEIANRLFSLPMIGDAFFPPVPIVVLAHFGDPRAADCREEARQVCRERLVIDKVISFDPSAVPPPTPTPSPTPFPSPEPAALFGPEACVGNVAYAFVGWTTTDVLNISREYDGHVFAMVTADPIPVSDWRDDPQGSGERFRDWGQRVCFSEDFQIGQPFNVVAISFDMVVSGRFREWEGGRREPLHSPY